MLRHVELVADHAPDRLGIDAVGESLIHRPAIELREDMILGHAVGIRVAELFAHSPPELREPHGQAGYPTPGPGPMWVHDRIVGDDLGGGSGLGV